MSTIKLPVKVEFELDMSRIKDTNLLDLIEKEFNDKFVSLFKKDWEPLKCEIKRNNDHLYIVIDGNANYVYTPGTGATFGNPGDPDDIDGFFDDDDLRQYIRDFMRDSKSYALEQAFLNSKLRLLSGAKIPTWDDIADAFYSDNSYDGPDYDYFENMESIMKSVLSGKSLTESLMNERADYDISSEEVYSDPAMNDIETFNRDKAAWKKDAIVKINALAIAVRDLKKVIEDGHIYGADLENTSGYPFKSDIFKMDAVVNFWTRKLHDDVNSLN